MEKIIICISENSKSNIINIYFLFLGNFQKINGINGSCICTTSDHSIAFKSIFLSGNKDIDATELLKGIFKTLPKS